MPILAHFLHILAGFHFCTFFGQIGRVSHLMSSLLHARMRACLMLYHLHILAHELIFAPFLAKLVVFPT